MHIPEKRQSEKATCCLIPNCVTFCKKPNYRQYEGRWFPAVGEGKERETGGAGRMISSVEIL